MPGPDPSSRRVSIVALLLYTAFVVYQSLAGGGAWQCSDTILAGGARLSRSDVIANVVAYVPLGLLLALATARTAHSSATGGVGGANAPRPAVIHVMAAAVGSVAVIAFLSTSLELVQACQPRRVSSILDVIANVAGGAAGVLAGVALRLAPAGIGARVPHRATTPAGRIRLLTAALVAAWIAAQTMPWAFAVDLGTIRSNLAFLRHWSDGPSLEVWRVLRHAGAWTAIACACRLAARSGRAAAVGLVLACAVSVLLQVLLDASAPLSMEELAGMAAAAAVLLPVTLYAGAQPDPRRWAMALMLAALVVVAAYELRPEPSATITQPFSLWPRVGLGGLLGALDYALLFGWFGSVAVVAARWVRLAGATHATRTWPVAAVLATLVLEAMQTQIPGRGPDLSAPVFTLLAVLGTASVLQERH